MPVKNATLLSQALRKRLYQQTQPVGMSTPRRMMLLRHRIAPPAGADTTPPGNINVTSITATKISRVVGMDSTQITFTADEAFVEYQIRIVSSPTDPITAGTLVEQALTG